MRGLTNNVYPPPRKRKIKIRDVPAADKRCWTEQPFQAVNMEMNLAGRLHIVYFALQFTENQFDADPLDIMMLVDSSPKSSPALQERMLESLKIA